MTTKTSILSSSSGRRSRRQSSLLFLFCLLSLSSFLFCAADESATVSEAAAAAAAVDDESSMASQSCVAAVDSNGSTIEGSCVADNTATEEATQTDETVTTAQQEQVEEEPVDFPGVTEPGYTQDYGVEPQTAETTAQEGDEFDEYDEYDEDEGEEEFNDYNEYAEGDEEYDEEDEEEFDEEEEHYLESDEFDSDEEFDSDDKAERVDEENEFDDVAEEEAGEEDQGQGMGVLQQLDNDELVRRVIATARAYWEMIFTQEEDYYGHHKDLEDACKNKDPRCAFWASLDECNLNPAYMQANCGPVCQSCQFALEKSREAYPDAQQQQTTTTITEDGEQREQNVENTGKSDEEYIPVIEEGDVGVDLGIPQKVRANETFRERIRLARDYMENVVRVEEKFEIVRDICVNKHQMCSIWAVHGECENNPGYMKINCAPVCQTCEQMHVSTRCPVNLTYPDALYPGDLNRMFERILQDPAMQQYEPKVLSRPDYAPGHDENTTDLGYQLGMWLVVFDNVATPEEAQRMLELAEEEGYSRSADVGDELDDGTFGDDINSGRTSENAWCQTTCMNDTVAMSIMDRMEHITGIHQDNAEHLQLLRYLEGQKYDTHNDYIPYQKDRPTGVRILTFFLYLNEVEEGGETAFPRLDLMVTPKTGRAVLWPSVFDDRPNENDVRSDHYARPVSRGMKYGANAWYHQRDVKTYNMDCL